MNLSLIKSHTIKQFADAEILNPTKAKTWFYFNEYGLCESTEIDKYTLATKLQIPLRDMRVLDPLFPTVSGFTIKRCGIFRKAFV